MSSEPTYEKVSFWLPEDEDGYPPDRWEVLWAVKIEEGLYELDNIPFFARGVSSGDVTRTTTEDGLNVFERVVTPSDNSIFRIYVLGDGNVQDARAEFRLLGCESELSHVSRLFSVEIPASRSLSEVFALIKTGADTGRWEFEEGCVRQKL